ncbi:UDP-2,3-diacylglucosamine diphosphatase [Candidatus Pelagadaptatus aseana]|uniref:UDP-2,3-diacylglucosamine diphosphatase n=1 Tax=Candidatus Pelagadaptatus aseana TaxID=3120508 RepID=UPI003C70172A
MTTLFISDLHLTPERPDITRAFQQFMTGKALEADTLYILGDFFEVWIGDDDDAPYVLNIIKWLREYSDSGHQLFFMCGNRDFLIGDNFAKAAGATLLSDPTVIDLYGIPTVLMHGDSLCTQDLEYMAFRQMSRAPAWQTELLAKPLAERRAIAQHLRQQSKSMSSMKAEDIMDVTPEEVVNTMNQLGATRMIHGHTHRPNVHPLQLGDTQGERMVLGDWGEKLWWIEATADSAPTLRQELI